MDSALPLPTEPCASAGEARHAGVKRPRESEPAAAPSGCAAAAPSSFARSPGWDYAMNGLHKSEGFGLRLEVFAALGDPATLAACTSAASAAAAVASHGTGAPNLRAAAAGQAWMAALRAALCSALPGDVQVRLAHFEATHGQFLVPLDAVEGYWARTMRKSTTSFGIQLNRCSLRSRNAQVDRGYTPVDDAVQQATGVAHLQVPLFSFVTGCIAEGGSARPGGGKNAAAQGCRPPRIPAKRISCKLIAELSCVMARAGLPYRGLTVGCADLSAADIAALASAMPPVCRSGGGGGGGGEHPSWLQSMHCSRLRDPRMSPDGHALAALLACAMTAGALGSSVRDLWATAHCFLGGADSRDFTATVTDTRYDDLVAARASGSLERIVDEEKRGVKRFQRIRDLRAADPADLTAEHRAMLDDHDLRQSLRLELGEELGRRIGSWGVPAGGLLAAAEALLPTSECLASLAYQVAGVGIRNGRRLLAEQDLTLIQILGILHNLVGPVNEDDEAYVQGEGCGESEDEDDQDEEYEEEEEEAAEEGEGDEKAVAAAEEDADGGEASCAGCSHSTPQPEQRTTPSYEAPLYDLHAVVDNLVSHSTRPAQAAAAALDAALLGLGDRLCAVDPDAWDAASAAATQGAIAQERAGMSTHGKCLRRARFASLGLTPARAAAPAAREEVKKAKAAKAAQVPSEKAVAAAAREEAKEAKAAKAAQVASEKAIAAAAREGAKEAKAAKAAQVASEKAIAAAAREGAKEEAKAAQASRREAAKASRAEESYHRAFPQERLHAARVAAAQLPSRPAGGLRVGVAPLSLGARVLVTIPTAAPLVRF